MARLKIVNFECEECGSEVIVTATGEIQLSPIYCCGVALTEMTPRVSNQTKPKKKITKKTTKKMTQKKVTQQKKPLPKKK